MFYTVNTFFTTFYIFIIHNLLTEMRLTFSIYREPYFFDRVYSYYNAFSRTKKRRAAALLIQTGFFAKRQIFRPQNQEFRQIGLRRFFFYI